MTPEEKAAREYSGRERMIGNDVYWTVVEMAFMAGYTACEEQNRKIKIPDNAFTLNYHGLGWVEINGLKWKVLEGKYKNEDLDGTKPINGIIQKSEATEACRLAGGRLPTKEDFEKLLENDDYKKLPGITDNCFWSSSVYPYYSYYAFYFNGNHGDVDYYFSRNDQGSVLCISR